MLFSCSAVRVIDFDILLNNILHIILYGRLFYGFNEKIIIRKFLIRIWPDSIVSWGSGII
jgi:hypothetical protein